MNADDLALLLSRPGYGIASGTRPNPKLERAPRDEPLAENQAQEVHSGKYLVRITSYRRRLLDVDNLAEKYHVDALRYAGLLPSDAPNSCSIETSQIKVQKKDQECTEVLIKPL